MEVNYNGQGWGTVCQNAWTIQNSDVVCRMLGFNSADSFTTGSSYGRGLGRIWFDNVNCTGLESKLLDCFSYNGPLVSSCNHNMDVGVACSCKLGVACLWLGVACLWLGVAGCCLLVAGCGLFVAGVAFLWLGVACLWLGVACLWLGVACS